MTDARNLTVQTLMRNRGCRKLCHAIKACDCQIDADAIIAALSAQGLVIVPQIASISHASTAATPSTDPGASK